MPYASARMDAPFDALVAAYEPGPGPGGLRALVPVAGRPLVEHQLRRAAAAGADRLFLLVDEVPLELAKVVTTLKREGLTVQPLRGLDMVADGFPADRACLLVADACLADEKVVSCLAAKRVPVLATLPDEAANERHERMDANTRWAGLALLDGARVAAAAAMLGSWDPVSTLLRRAVQEGAARLDVADAPPVLLLDPSEVAEANERIIAAARPQPTEWVERWIILPVLGLVVPRLVQRGTAAEALALPATGATLLAGGLALAGWRWLPLLLLLVAAPVLAAGRQLARVADRPLTAARIVGWACRLGHLLAVVGLSVGLFRASGQWGWLLLGGAVPAAVTVSRLMGQLVRRPAPLWLTDVGPLAWTLLPFALIGRWDGGMVALCLYATISLGLRGRFLLQQAAADAGVEVPRLF